MDGRRDDRLRESRIGARDSAARKLQKLCEEIGADLKPEWGDNSGEHGSTCARGRQAPELEAARRARTRDSSRMMPPS